MRSDNFRFNNINIEQDDYFEILKILDSNKINSEYHVQRIYDKDNLYVIHSLSVDRHYTIIPLVKELITKTKHKKK